jgi:Kef-type K+ transport system membrane component KefB
MPFFDHMFTELAAVLAVAVAVGCLCLCLRQPLIIAFILVGVLVGPVGLDWVHAYDQLDLFAELGVGLLLFVVGLKLHPGLIRSVGPVALVAGGGQMIITAGLGFLLAVAFGFSGLPAFYVAAALTFSSTIIIVKLLSDKREIDALHGRIALGILIMQDIAVVLLMLGLAVYGKPMTETRMGWQLLLVAGKGVAFLALTALTARYLLQWLLPAMARSAELMVLFAIAWCAGLAAVGVELGFSKEVGAFIAGVSLATTPFRAALAARLTSVRDFLLLFFFIDLGLNIDVVHLGAAVGPALALSLFVLVGKPLMVMALVSAMGYTRKTSTVTGLTLGQISEFSFILAALGLSLGHIGDETVGLITLVGLITIGVSTYMILHAYSLSNWLMPLTRLMEWHKHHPEQDFGDDAGDLSVDVIIFGMGRYGRNIALELRNKNFTVLGVDFDPEVVRYWHGQGFPTLYGDVEDPELYHSLPLRKARWVVNTIRGRDQSLVLLQALRHHEFKGRIALTAHTAADKGMLTEDGASLVLLPFRDAAKEAADLLQAGMEPTFSVRERHELQLRRSAGGMN